MSDKRGPLTKADRERLKLDNDYRYRQDALTTHAIQQEKTIKDLQAELDAYKLSFNKVLDNKMALNRELEKTKWALRLACTCLFTKSPEYYLEQADKKWNGDNPARDNAE